MAGPRSALCRLSRRRMGRAGTRRSRPLEKLILDGFQAGLSWITILRKRDAFRAAFDGFDPEKIARYDAEKGRGVDAGRRHRAQPRQNRGGHVSAGAWLKLRKGPASPIISGTSSTAPRSRTPFAITAKSPPQSDSRRAFQRIFKKRGFNFCGPTIIYAFCQATGMVNDHIVDCFRHAECSALARRA